MAFGIAGLVLRLFGCGGLGCFFFSLPLIDLLLRALRDAFRRHGVLEHPPAVGGAGEAAELEENVFDLLGCSFLQPVELGVESLGDSQAGFSLDLVVLAGLLVGDAADRDHRLLHASLHGGGHLELRRARLAGGFLG